MLQRTAWTSSWDPDDTNKKKKQVTYFDNKDKYCNYNKAHAHNLPLISTTWVHWQQLLV